MNVLLVILSVVGILTARNLNTIDPCILSCMLQMLPMFGCEGNEDNIVACGCGIIDRYAIVGPIAHCTEKDCNISLKDFPPALQNTDTCWKTFGPEPDTTLPRSIPSIGSLTSSRSLDNIVLGTSSPPGDSVSGTSIPTSTSPPSHDLSNTPTSTPNTTPRSTLDASGSAPPSGTSIRTASGTQTLTLVGNAPIGSQADDGQTAAPTVPPAPPSDGPGLSPTVIATIVISTVTVIGVPLWLIRCYRWRKSRATSNVEGNVPPVPAEKRNESVVMGYTELLGSTEMRHEMQPNSPTNAPLPLYVDTIAEIDSNPLRKAPEASPEEVSPDDAASQAISFSTTTAVSRPEPQQAAEEDEATTVAPEDSPIVKAETETELDMLGKTQSELERNRQSLEQIQEIEEEGARIQQRIDELEQQSQPPG